MLRCAAVVLCAGFATAAAAQTTTTTGTNSTDGTFSFESNSCSNSANWVRRPITISATGVVTRVRVGLLMTHAYRDEIGAFLIAPDGTQVRLINNVGGAADNYSALLADGSPAQSGYTANSTITATTESSTAGVEGTPFAAYYAPSSPLSAMNGKTANGTWEIAICDDTANDNGTFFHAWLEVQSRNDVADLSLSKTVNNSTPTINTNVTYALTVTNASSSTQTANAVTVRDVLPTGVTFISATGAGTFNNTTGIWTVPSLAPGSSHSLYITVRVSGTSGQTITNSAEVAASDRFDPDSSPNNGTGGSEDDRASVSLTTYTTGAATPPTLMCPLRTMQFNWDNHTGQWAAGSVSNTMTNVEGIGTLGVSIVAPSPGVFLNNATLGGQSPSLQTALNGGISGNSLVQIVDLGANTDVVTTTMTLGASVAGAQFSLFDVDYNLNQFTDQIEVRAYLGATEVPVTVSNGLANTASGQVVTGNGASDTGAANGNMTATIQGRIDRIVIRYGNQSSGTNAAPANPGQQAVSIGDINFCEPETATVAIDKTSTLVSDPINNTTNPFAVPGARIRYCLQVSHTSGNSAANAIRVTDVVPSTMTVVPGSLRTGATCATATSVEDDNNTGTDETDPAGASVSGQTVVGILSSLSIGTSGVLVFDAVVK